MREEVAGYKTKEKKTSYHIERGKLWNGGDKQRERLKNGLSARRREEKERGMEEQKDKSTNRNNIDLSLSLSIQN